jgi:hypothetical protein
MVIMIKFNNIYIEFYIFAFLLAVAFYLFSNVNTNQLVSVIIIILLGIGIYLYLDRLSNSKDSSSDNIENTLDNDIQERKETNEKLFYIDKFPKKVNYLKQSKELMQIVTNLRFTTKFNKTRYSDLILNMNKMMKVYIYILADRYDAVQFIPVFTDIRQNILEIMYSLFMIIPKQLKHIYALDPHIEIYRSIYDFVIHSRGMLEILEKFAKIHNEAAYIPDSSCLPYNSIQDRFFP